MRQTRTLWPPQTDPYRALAVYQSARDTADAAAVARVHLLEAAVGVARDAGWSVVQIADHLGLSRSHVARFYRKNGLIQRPKSPTADNHMRVSAAIDAAIRSIS